MARFLWWRQAALSENSRKDYTKITFYPDFSRFSGMVGLDDDIVALMTKRACV